MSKETPNVMDVKNYFSTPLRPVLGPEMTTFWKSLTEEEKEYYKNAVAEQM